MLRHFFIYHQVFESVLYLQIEVFLYKVTCLASSLSAQPNGISKLWKNRENVSRVENTAEYCIQLSIEYSGVENTVASVLSWLIVLGNLGAS